MEKPLKMRLHVISPLHIGCDEVYEPTGFKVDEAKKKIIVFDPMDLIKSLSPEDRDKYSSICAEGTLDSIINIFKYLSGQEVKGREIEVSGAFIEHFGRVKNKPIDNKKEIKKEINQFTINRTAYNPYNHLPYIPGSSLKGGLRTAYLTHLAQEGNVKDYWNKLLRDNELEKDSDKYWFIGKKNIAKQLEKNLLQGNFDKDPFRMVKVSDLVPVNDVETEIVYAVNKKKKISKFGAKGPYQMLEIIKEGSAFDGIINIQEPQQGTGIKRSIKTKVFMESIQSFFTSNSNNENEVIKKINVESSVIENINEKLKEKLEKSAFLIRIGRHSGAEAMTIGGNRYIKVTQGKKPPKFLDHATTIWLASDTSKPQINNNLAPFGWAILEFGEMGAKFVEPVASKKRKTADTTKYIDLFDKPFASALKKQGAGAKSEKKIKVGNKVQGECFEEKGQLKLKLTGNKGEIVTPSGSYLPWSPGQKVKVKIEKISSDGMILKIRP